MQNFEINWKMRGLTFNAGTTSKGVWVKSSDGIHFEKCEFYVYKGIYEYYIQEKDLGNMTSHFTGFYGLTHRAEAERILKEINIKQEQSLNAQKNDTFEFKLKRGRWTIYLQNSKTWVKTDDNMNFYPCKFYIRQIDTKFYIYEEELLDVTFQVTGASYFSNYANAATSLEQLNNAKVQKEGHVHAELMLEYAKDSVTDSEAWKKWQYKANYMTSWGDTSGTPVWNTKSKYRRKPAMFGILKALESYRLGFKVTREGPAHSMISFNQDDLDSTDWYIVN